MLLLAFWRYVGQRAKATDQAYRYIITLEASRGGTHGPPPHRDVEGSSQAGSVVFRRAGDNVEYLLVQAKNFRREWVLPKGHIELGEPAVEAAVREVPEETGVWARLKTI